MQDNIDNLLDTLFESCTKGIANDLTSDNANTAPFTPAGIINKVGVTVSKYLATRHLIRPEVRSAIDDGTLYIHDLDYYMTGCANCIQVPIDRILKHGVKFQGCGMRPAHHIESACAQACIILQTTQNEMFGGQAIPALDYYLAPYVKSAFIEALASLGRLDPSRDYAKYITESYAESPSNPREINQAIQLTTRRVSQAIEAMVHNFNTMHSRGGNQVVFSSINYGTDDSPEGRVIISTLLDALEAGVGDGNTAIFPIHVFKVKSGINRNPGDPLYQYYLKAIRCCVTRFFPNFLNLDAPFNINPHWRAEDPERYKWELATMGCRTRVFTPSTEDPTRMTTVGRGNLSFTSINLPGIALRAGKDIDKFYTLLDENISLAITALKDRAYFQASQPKYKFPMLMSGLWDGSKDIDPKSPVGDILLKYGTLGVGFIGLAEALILLTGHHHGEDDESQKLGINIISHMGAKCVEAKADTGLNYSLFATPGESLCSRFCDKDLAKFGIIKYITDKGYYTNSFHVPVYYSTTAAHKIDVEAPYHALTPGGHIFYAELDYDGTKNLSAVKQVIDYALSKDLGYISINHTTCQCPGCGYEGQYEGTDPSNVGPCPRCGNTMTSLSRVTGYLSASYEKQTCGKKREILQRVPHTFVLKFNNHDDNKTQTR